MTLEFCAQCGSKKLHRFSDESIPLHDGTPVTGLSGMRCANDAAPAIDNEI